MIERIRLSGRPQLWSKATEEGRNTERDTSYIENRLGLPQVDKTKTRQNVRLLFKVYRQYRGYFRCGRELSLEEDPSLAKYKDAVDPKTRHPVNKPSSGVRPPDDRELMMRGLMRDVERKVSKLKDLQRELIKVKFMGDEELNDFDALSQLEELEFYMGDATFARHKQAAMMRIASLMGVEEYK